MNASEKATGLLNQVMVAAATVNALYYSGGNCSEAMEAVDARKAELLEYVAKLEEAAHAARAAWDDAACNEEGTLYDVPSAKMRAVGNAVEALGLQQAFPGAEK